MVYDNRFSSMHLPNFFGALPSTTLGSDLMATTLEVAATSLDSPSPTPPKLMLYLWVSIRTVRSRLSMVVRRWKRGSNNAAAVRLSLDITCAWRTLEMVRFKFIIRGSSCSAMPNFLIRIFEVIGESMLHKGMSSPRSVSKAI